MIIHYYSIYDEKTQMFGPLFPSHTPGSAERSLKESMSNPDSPHSKYPEDFALYAILDLDDSTGLIESSHEPPQLVVRASQLVSS